MQNLNLEIIHQLYPRTKGHKVLGISEATKMNQVANAKKLHSEYISFLVRAEGDYYITPANGHGNIYSIVKKMVESGFDTINFAIEKTDRNGVTELLYPDYKISEFLAS